MHIFLIIASTMQSHTTPSINCFSVILILIIFTLGFISGRLNDKR